MQLLSPKLKPCVTTEAAAGVSVSTGEMQTLASIESMKPGNKAVLVQRPVISFFSVTLCEWTLRHSMDSVVRASHSCSGDPVGASENHGRVMPGLLSLPF